MRMRLFLAGGLVAMAGLSPAASQAAQTHSTGTLRFHVTVTGKAHDSGTIAVPIAAVNSEGEFDGCAIVKQKAAANVLGAQTYEIHVHYMGGTNLLAAGVQPYVKQEIYLRISGYRTSVVAYPDVSERPVDLSFAVNGRAYSTYLHATTHIRNGGRDGTINGGDAERLYPATTAHPLHGVTFQASWHCSRVLHTTSQF